MKILLGEIQDSATWREQTECDHDKKKLRHTTHWDGRDKWNPFEQYSFGQILTESITDRLFLDWSGIYFLTERYRLQSGKTIKYHRADIFWPLLVRALSSLRCQSNSSAVELIKLEANVSFFPIMFAMFVCRFSVPLSTPAISRYTFVMLLSRTR